MLPSIRDEHAGEFHPIKVESPHPPPDDAGGGESMGLDVVHARCAGIDVHKRQVTVCVDVPGVRELQEFGTDTASLLGLVDWLVDLRIADIAMEGTGSFWKPVYNLLEGVP